ncbi:hypothetical protein [Actinomycetospora chiangmaiensis]|uniref:hypothetical protein n=1 Tax=Actinomycetospora chiangmaiensis TaxID=402650 RepID=UPI00037EF4F9|nr:hypothetical protein [Actinomycetospora chiangmaiensis]
MSQPSQLVNTRLLISGAVLTGVGSMLATLGLALGGAAAVGAARRWQQRTEMTPAQLALHAYGAARTAQAAGLSAWRNPTPTPIPAQRTSSRDAGVPVS